MVIMTEPTSTMPLSSPKHTEVIMDEAIHVDAELTQSPNRLMITKMELENFKSYAGVKTIGPFHKCFSSVVGPNGSGKSNVIDAMLFVFGKRAKKLRLNKVSELIHTSDAYTSQNSQLQFARVSVYFHDIIDTGDGDDDYEVVPNSQVVITRIAKRDNSSVYKIDDRTCTFRDVATYLNSKGIDLDNNRFLILQGEVEMISMMPPKGKNEGDEGLLEYLEDIIGSNKYVEKANEAEAKVEALTEQRQEKLNRVKAVEKEMDNLQGAKQEAEALLGKEREILKKKNIYFQIEEMNATKEVRNAIEKKQSLTAKLEEEKESLIAAESRLLEIDRDLTIQNQEYQKVHAELTKTKEEFAAFERRDIQLREEIKHEKAKKKKLQEKVNVELKKSIEAEAKAKAAEESIPTLEDKVSDFLNIKSVEDTKLEALFEETKGKTETLRKDLEMKTQELAPVSQERAIFQAALDTAMTEVQLLEDSTSRAKEQLHAAEQELASLDSVQQEKQAKLESFKVELSESKQRVIDYETEDSNLLEREKELSQRHTELTTQAEGVKASLQHNTVRSNAVKGILQAATQGGELSKVGILGRLGDLATISEEYDVAISTACGMLDHIVIQTTAGAQRCLDFLRKYNLGRANFIPLDKMKKGAHDHVVETPEGAPRLFDLISPSNFAITPALYLGVGNTLVAQDLETATRWAYEYGKRWRVVTIDGNLIEISGTMQGGGKSVRRGGMRLSNEKFNSASGPIGCDSQDECTRLEELVMKALNDLKDCRSRRREIGEQIRELKKRVKFLGVAIPKLSMEIDGCDTSRLELTRRLPTLKVQCHLSSSDKEKLVALNKNVEKCKSAMTTCVSLASKLESEVGQLQKQILDAGGSKLKNQQKACDKARSDVDNATKELNAAKVTIISCNKAAEKAAAAKESAEKDLGICLTVLEEKKSELKNLESEAYEVMQAFEKVKDIELEQKKKLEEVTKEYDSLKQLQSKAKYTEVELVAKLDSCQKTIQDNEKSINMWQRELEKLRLEEEYHEFDDVEVPDEVMESKLVVDENDVKMIDGRAENISDAEHTPGTTSKRKETSLSVLPVSALEQYCLDEVKRDINILEKERDAMAKNANMTAIDEYRKKEVDYFARIAELDQVTELRSEATKSFEELRRFRLEKFMEGFNQITVKLKEMYQMITLGGDAELELVDSLDPFSEGIVFSVRPPKKSWKNISNLSGGEKTLSSLALVFALHHYKPTPLYVMDEIDAALDFKNVSIVANYIKERTKNAQFIIISLRNNMFELADRLVGIYKTFNCTKSITIDPKAFSSCGLVPTLKTNLPLTNRTNTSGVADLSSKSMNTSKYEDRLVNQSVFK